MTDIQADRLIRLSRGRKETALNSSLKDGWTPLKQEEQRRVCEARRQ